MALKSMPFSAGAMLLLVVVVVVVVLLLLLEAVPVEMGLSCAAFL